MRRQRMERKKQPQDRDTVQLVSISNSNNNKKSASHTSEATMSNINEFNSEEGFRDEPQLPSSPYQRVDEEDINTPSSTLPSSSDAVAARASIRNFALMSFLFSANHGCVVACLSLATSQFGSTGAWQSGILYLTYTASALLGATYIVKRLGSRDSLMMGMGLYCLYVACFWIATIVVQERQRILAAYVGAAIGGVGAGFLWTAQGAYFTQAAEEHSRLVQQPLAISTASLAGIFAFLYLAEEVGLRLLSTVILQFEIASWGVIFAVYTLVTVISAAAMSFVHKYPSTDNTEDDDEENDGNIESANRVWYKVTAAWQVLRNDPKMKYMVGLNAVFGFTGAFLNSYVNGEVIPIALNDPDAKYVGLLSSWVSGVAAGMSLLFGKITPSTGKGPVLILGALCFMGVVMPFLLVPDISNDQFWGWSILWVIYTLHGTGRATFEGTLKATFADYFAYEKEGAFANIILQNGLSGAVGYVLTFSLLCDNPASRYCVEYSNGTLHDVLSFELIVVGFAISAILGYWRSSILFKNEQQNAVTANGGDIGDNADLLEDAEDISS